MVVRFVGLFLVGMAVAAFILVSLAALGVVVPHF